MVALLKDSIKYAFEVSLFMYTSTLPSWNGLALTLVQGEDVVVVDAQCLHNSQGFIAQHALEQQFVASAASLKRCNTTLPVTASMTNGLIQAIATYEDKMLCATNSVFVQ